MAIARGVVYVQLVIDKVKSKRKDADGLPAALERKGIAARNNKNSEGESRKWFDALEYVLEYALKDQSSEQASFFVDNLMDRLLRALVF